MGNYADQITQLDFPKQVADIRTHLANVPQASRDALQQVDPGAEARLEALLDHVLVLTATVTPEIVPTDRPGQLQAMLTEVNNGLAYLDNPDNMPGYANQLVNAANNLAALLWTWQGSASGDDWKDSVTGAAATYRRSLGQQVSSLNAELDDLKAKVVVAKQELENTKETAQQFQSDMGDELRALKERNAEQLSALAAQIETINTQVTAAVDRQDASIRQYQEQFSAAQEKRSTDFAELLQSSRQAASDARTELDSAGKQSIKELHAQIEKAKEMVSVFAGAGTANAFGKEAKEQGKAADIWRIVAIVLAILGAAAAAVLILAFGSKTASVAEVTGKLAVAVVVGGAAGYAASQSSSHRKREVSNRRAELLLVSFEPFVRDLPTEEQDKARVALLQSLMTDTGHIVTADGKSEPAITASELNLFKQFIDLWMKR